MTTFLNDTFTGADGTNLESHTGETGALWTVHPSFVGSAKIATNRIHTNGALRAYYASGVPASADYDVEAVMFIKSHVNAGGPCGRMSTTADTSYSVRMGTDGTNNLAQLVKIVAGVVTALGTAVATGVADNGFVTLRLQMRGSTIKMFVGGVEKTSATDTDITAAGRAGGRGNSSATVGYWFESILAIDQVIAPQGGATADGLPPVARAAATAGGADAEGNVPAARAPAGAGGALADGSPATARGAVGTGGALAAGTTPAPAAPGGAPGGAEAHGTPPTSFTTTLTAGGASAGGVQPALVRGVTPPGGANVQGLAPLPAAILTIGGALADGRSPTEATAAGVVGGAAAGGNTASGEALLGPVPWLEGEGTAVPGLEAADAVSATASSIDELIGGKGGVAAVDGDLVAAVSSTTGRLGD